MTQGTLKSLAHAVEVYYEELRHFVRQRTQSSTVAEDVIQETWIRASTVSVAMPDNPKAYLYRMASNLANDYLRQSMARAFTASIENYEEPCESQHLQPDAVIAAQQEVEILSRAVQELPDKCREVFMLYRNLGLTMRQIAEHLAISESTVEKHIARAMTHCRKKLRAAGREV